MDDQNKGTGVKRNKRINPNKTYSEQVSLDRRKIKKLFQLTPACLTVYLSIISRMACNRNGFVVINNKLLRSILCEETRLADDTVDKAIQILAKENFMRREAPGMYIINPNFASTMSYTPTQHMIERYEGIRADGSEVSFFD